VLAVLVVEGAGEVVGGPTALVDGVETPVADISDPQATVAMVTAMASTVVRFTGSTVPDSSDATLVPCALPVFVSS
jgi:hypothetical protein